MADSGVAAYYDRLARWNSMARAVGYGGGSDALTVHRGLADPTAQGGVTTTRLHDLLVEQLPPMFQPRVLDAGCGLGGTMLALVERWGGDYTGLTLSTAQAAVAADAVRAAGYADRVRVSIQSYDHPPDGPFDLIVAIESLIHSLDPAESLRALTRVLAPGGAIAIVDDMPEPAARQLPELAIFKTGWGCGVMWDRDRYVRAFEELGLRVVHDLDLSADCRPRSFGRIRLMTWLNRVVGHVVPSRTVRQIMASHLGGLALEQLLRTGLVRYRLLVARR